MKDIRDPKVGDDVDLEDAPLPEDLPSAADTGMAEILRAACAPGDLDALRHEAILERALGRTAAERSEDGTEATTEEVEASTLLRQAMEAPRDLRSGGHPLVELVVALRAAYRPAELSALRSQAMAAVAVRNGRGGRGGAAVVAAALAISALAAGWLLMMVRGDSAAPAPSAANGVVAVDPTWILPGMVESRSTVPLFESTDFPRDGGTSARSDRMAEARRADLRRNRFVAWGTPCEGECGDEPR